MKYQIMEDVIICALEGGSNYWYRIETDTKGDYLGILKDNGLEISNYYIQNEDKPQNALLNKTSMKKGMQLMHNKYPWHYANVITENFDAITGDVYLQLCLFGDIIYG